MTGSENGGDQPMQLAFPLPTGEKAKAHDIITAIRTLQEVEREGRPATQDEKQALARFGGFGPVALSIFPHATSGRYKDAAWQEQLSRARPGSDPAQIASEALEIALSELEGRLPPVSPPPEDEAPSLEEAVAFLRRHTPAG